MKLCVCMVMALGMVAGAEAQTASVPFTYLPVPETVPEAMAGLIGSSADGADIVASIRATIPTAISIASSDPSDIVVALESLQTSSDYPATPDPAVAPLVPPMSTVTIVVNGVKSAAGTVYVAICDKGLSREGCPYKGQVAAAAGFVEAKLSNIPPGRYAVVGFHDKNANGEFDKFLGMPREPYALSGRAGDELVPRFDDALVTLADGDNAVAIALKSPLGR